MSTPNSFGRFLIKVKDKFSLVVLRPKVRLDADEIGC